MIAKAAGALLFGAASLPYASGSLRTAQQHRARDIPDSWVEELEKDTGRIQPLDMALKMLAKKHNHNACLTIAEREDGFMGGFANGVGFVNSVYDFAARFGTHFIFPKLVTKAHQDGSDYDGIFGPQSQNICSVQQYEVQCDKHQPKDDARDWSREKHRCDLRQYVVDMESAKKTKARACGCEALVAVDLDHMQWHFDYTKTHNWLRTIYWEAQEMHPAMTHRPTEPCHHSVAVHVRLGDVAAHRDAGKNWAEKYVEPETYMTMLRALSAVVHPSCLEVSIITDGEADDMEPKAVADGVRELGMVDPVILDVHTLAQDAFATLTHADVLVCGGSGFCRLAAVLAKSEAARICIETHDHPVGFLPNVTELQLPGSTAETIMTEGEVLQAMRDNLALRAMAMPSL